MTDIRRPDPVDDELRGDARRAGHLGVGPTRSVIDQLHRRGWVLFAPSAAMDAWIARARPAAAPALADPDYAGWFRHDHSWFVGVDALPNDRAGAIAAGPPLSGP